jgi:hypothetical protein
VSILNTLRGVLYMGHWILVMATVTLRMAVRPKRLRWVKTNHAGLEADASWLDLESVPEVAITVARSPVCDRCEG